MSNLSKEIQNSQVCCGEFESPIDEFKLENCYIPNGETYPLCKGQDGNNKCKNCNVYENMIEPYDNY